MGITSVSAVNFGDCVANDSVVCVSDVDAFEHIENNASYDTEFDSFDGNFKGFIPLKMKPLQKKLQSENDFPLQKKLQSENDLPLQNNSQSVNDFSLQKKFQSDNDLPLQKNLQSKYGLQPSYVLNRFNIQKIVDGNKLELKLFGDFGVDAVSSFDSIMQDLDNVQELTFDLNGVTHVTNAGLKVLLSMQKVMTQHHGSTKLVHVPENVLSVLDVTGLGDRFTIER